MLVAMNAAFACPPRPYRAVSFRCGSHQLREPLDSLYQESEMTCTREAAKKLQRQANLEVQAGNENAARDLLQQKKKLRKMQDHVASCPQEREQIIRAGGEVKWQIDTWRIGPAALQVTRSIGDDDLKPAVTAEPEITETDLSSDDEFLEAEEKLEKLYAAVGNSSKFMPAEDEVNEEVVSILREASEKKLEHVILSGHMLRYVPEAFGRIHSLVTLNLSNNQLEACDECHVSTTIKHVYSRSEQTHLDR
ncbi:kinase and PP2C-like domain-containing protein [Nymphaea thermarum]|nr:kinase and PP2C-like domain-containing protein [Nymphaea thermarum]